MEFSNVTTDTQQNRVANKLPSGNVLAIFKRYIPKILERKIFMYSNHKYKSHEKIIKERDSYIEKKRLENEIKYYEEIQKTKPKNLDKTIVTAFVQNKNADNRLYYFRFKFKNNIYYKLGITSQTLKERYGSDYKKIDKILYNEKINSAIKIERELKFKYKDDIFPLKYFNDGGHTEIFDKDILNLDTKE